ncbi:MAG: hypothetical protein QOJ02_2048 [Acidobacteriota bacterium]|nr:hypothetical protein [Acidobacteriota bacterium]
MSYVLRARESAIGELLEKCASLVERVGQGEWNFILNNGSMLLTSARVREHWLHLDAPLKAGTARSLDAWQLLQLNQNLGGLSKVALLHGQQPAALRVRAEIPLDEDVDLQARLSEACAGMKAAAGRLHGEEKEEQTRADSLTGSDEPDLPEHSELRNLCEESGWKFTERTATKLAVDLEARSGFYQAIVEEQPGGAVSVAVELASGAVFGESSKRAIGTLLLRASAEVRLARGVVKERDEGASFEVLFQTTPCAAELSHALSALAVACGLCGQEAVMMQDEFVAKNYLASQGLLMKLK